MTHKTQAGRYASPPCLAGEVAPDWFDPLAVDAQQAIDVARWRRAQRARLIAERQALSVAARRAAGAAMARHVEAFLEALPDGARGRILSAWWPIRGEPDLRPLMARLHERGVVVALPVAQRPAAPMSFRRWTPGCALERGVWNIPVPHPEAGALVPEIVLAPLVGWDGAGYRLGHGGGYFDRTLAARMPRPLSIGVGFDAARLATIYPQPHDIALDAIVTETGLQVRKERQ